MTTTLKNSLTLEKVIELWHMRNSWWEKKLGYWEILFDHNWKLETANGVYIRVFYTLDTFPCEEHAAFQVQVGKGDNIYWCSIPRPCYEIMSDIVDGLSMYYDLDDWYGKKS